MTREEIKKQWELEFGAKYEDYQRANVYTAVDILDFAELVVNKLLIPRVVGQSEQLVICKKCGSSEMYQYTKTKDKCEDCGNIQDY